MTAAHARGPQAPCPKRSMLPGSQRLLSVFTHLPCVAAAHRRGGAAQQLRQTEGLAGSGDGGEGGEGGASGSASGGCSAAADFSTQAVLVRRQAPAANTAAARQRDGDGSWRKWRWRRCQWRR
eukprot:6201759-Pleurochrysis_carterae.AAC.1